MFFVIAKSIWEEIGKGLDETLAEGVYRGNGEF